MREEKVLQKKRSRRQYRVRNKVRKHGRPRLSVVRTNKHLYCQLIDDVEGKTLASASTRDASLRGELSSTGNCDAAVIVGKAIAERAQAVGVKEVALDRGRFKYHGRVASLAAAAREGGLEF